MPMRGRKRKIWDSLVREMEASGVLRSVDAIALAQMCTDQALLDDLVSGLEAMTKELVEKAKQRNMDLSGGPVVHQKSILSGLPGRDPRVARDHDGAGPARQQPP
jgi:hypothetical protein